MRASRRSTSSFPIPGRRSATTSAAWCSPSSPREQRASSRRAGRYMPRPIGRTMPTTWTRYFPWNPCSRRRTPGWCRGRQRNSRRAGSASATLSAICTGAAGEKGLQQIVEEAPTALGGPDALPIPRDQASFLRVLDTGLNDLERQPSPLAEERDLEAVDQAKGVQHELERQLRRRHPALFHPRVWLHVLSGLLGARVARHAVGEAQLAVRAGADSQVVAELPVVEVVAAAPAGASEGRSLVVLVTRGAELLFDDELHVGGDVVLGKRGRLAPEHGIRLESQLVRGNMRQSEAQGLVQIGPRHCGGLSGQRGHDVDVHVVEACERRLDGAARLAGGMDPAERVEHAIVEALHADGDAVHAGAAEAAEARRLDGAGVRFERDLGLRVEREPRAHAGEQRVDRLRREEARGAATDEDADDTAPPNLG